MCFFVLVGGGGGGGGGGGFNCSATKDNFVLLQCNSKYFDLANTELLLFSRFL